MRSLREVYAYKIKTSKESDLRENMITMKPYVGKRVKEESTLHHFYQCSHYRFIKITFVLDSLLLRVLILRGSPIFCSQCRRCTGS
jgi:hypothetical protein